MQSTLALVRGRFSNGWCQMRGEVMAKRTVPFVFSWEQQGARSTRWVFVDTKTRERILG